MSTVELPGPLVPAVPAPRASVTRPRRPAGRRPAPLQLRVPGRTLLLVAGMPGAGKSTLLAALPRTPQVAVLDSDEHRRALARLLPRVAYRHYRPLVHLRHRIAVVRAACSGTPTVVVHLPATDAVTRAVVALLAALTGRSAHLLWLHVDPAEALRGQRDRGRTIPPGSFAGHARRAVAATARLRGSRPVGWSEVVLVDRVTARAGLVLDTRTP